MVLRICIRPIAGSVSCFLAIMDIRAHPISFATRALEGRKYIKITDATVRPFLHFLNPTRRPRQESFGFVAVYLSGPSWTLPRWFQACLITPPLRPAAQREPHSDVPAPRQSRRSAPACWRAQLPEHCGAIAALRR